MELDRNHITLLQKGIFLPWKTYLVNCLVCRKILLLGDEISDANHMLIGQVLQISPDFTKFHNLPFLNFTF